MLPLPSCTYIRFQPDNEAAVSRYQLRAAESRDLRKQRRVIQRQQLCEVCVCVYIRCIWGRRLSDEACVFAAL